MYSSPLYIIGVRFIFGWGGWRDGGGNEIGYEHPFKLDGVGCQLYSRGHPFRLLGGVHNGVDEADLVAVGSAIGSRLVG